MQEAITLNRRQIDPHLLFVFIVLYKNTKNQMHRSCCVLFILPSIAGPYKLTLNKFCSSLQINVQITSEVQMN